MSWPVKFATAVLGTVAYLALAVIGWGGPTAFFANPARTALILIPLIARMNAEERLLQSEFGAEYDAYRARTARLAPGLY